MRRVATAAVTGFGVLVLLSSCSAGAENTVILGATTSVSDTGLLDEIVAAFEEQSGYHVKPVVGGSGDILERARRGELDVVITHSPADEADFVGEGFGLEPKQVMENYFIVAGPPDDPAGVAAASTVEDAFRAIADEGAPFISRGDKSGTNKRELAVWEALDIDPTGHDWYQESAVSQGQNALVASDKGAYTLVDSSTMAALQDRVNLTAFVTDTENPNVYTVILVNPANHRRVNEEAARVFATFLTGPEARRLISEFGRDEFGEALFVPLAGDPAAAVTP